MKLGLQKKYVLTISIFLLIVFSLSGWGIISYTSALTRENIQKQQYAMTGIIARSIDDKLGTWLATLADIGRTVPEDVFHDQEKAQKLVDQISGIRSMFTSGIMLLDDNFRVVAENPYIANRKGKKVAELEPFLKTVVENGLPDISNPYWDQLEHYIIEHSDADFSHGVCPDCYEKQMEEIKKLNYNLA